MDNFIVEIKNLPYNNNVYMDVDMHSKEVRMVKFLFGKLLKPVVKKFGKKLVKRLLVIILICVAIFAGKLVFKKIMKTLSAKVPCCVRKRN